ncbi:MAG: lipid II:glycine glycyltransferase FemX [Limisphaerales bacterium]
MNGSHAKPSLVTPGGEVRFVAGDTPADAARWDAFVARCPDPHFEQLSGFGLVKQAYGWKPFWVWAERDGKILGGAQILIRRPGSLSCIGYVSRGPIWEVGPMDSMPLALEAVCRFGRQQRCAYFVVNPPYGGAALHPLLKASHFQPKPETIPPTGIITATLTLNLQLDLEVLMAGMNRGTRRNILNSENNRVTVRLGEGREADVFRELMWALCRRRGVSPNPPQRDFFTNLWRHLGESGAFRLFFAEVQGEIVSGGCLLAYGDRVGVWKAGWTGSHRHCSPNHALWWQIIKWAKAEGYRQFDFMQILPDHARAILRGERIQDSYSGVTDFKMGFGGQLLMLPEPCYRSFHPVIQATLRLGASRFLGSTMAARLTRKAAK